MRIWPAKRKKPRKMPEGTFFSDGRDVCALLEKHLGAPVESAEILNYHGYLSLKVKIGGELYKVAECESPERALLAEKALKAVARDNGPVPGFVCRTDAVIVCEWVHGSSCKKENRDVRERHVLACQEALYNTVVPDTEDAGNQYVHLESLITRFQKAVPGVISDHRINAIVSSLRERLPAPDVPRILHPDLTPTNIIVDGSGPVIIDNEVIGIGAGFEFDVWNSGEALYGRRNLKGIEAYVRRFHERCPAPTLFAYQAVWDDFRRLRRAIKEIKKGRRSKARRLINQIYIP